VKTRAAILVEQKHPLVIDEVEVPPLQHGQVLVDVEASRICGSQIGEIDGVKGPDKHLPHLLGHEGGGTVLEIGPGVRHVRVGDRVVMHWRPGAGQQSAPPVYRWGNKAVSAGWLTTFNDKAVVSEDRLTAVDTSVDFDECCLFADTLTTGLGVVANDAAVKPGQSVVVVGCGGIGLGTVLAAHLAGAHPIIAVDLHQHKLDKAQAFGATHAILSSKADFIAEAKQIMGGHADVVIDGTGRPAIIEQCWALTSSVGACVLVGVMPHWQALSLNTLPLHFGKRLVGSHGGDSRPATDIPRYLALLRQRKIPLKDFISHRVRLEQVNETIARMRSGEVVHAIIEF
jgi:S-(hydroxymethyl)glutathione dehydrogenase/alcohol dehydrogenase